MKDTKPSLPLAVDIQDIRDVEASVIGVTGLLALPVGADGGRLGEELNRLIVKAFGGRTLSSSRDWDDVRRNFVATLRLALAELEGGA